MHNRALLYIIILCLLTVAGYFAYEKYRSDRLLSDERYTNAWLALGYTRVILNNIERKDIKEKSYEIALFNSLRAVHHDPYHPMYDRLLGEIKIISEEHKMKIPDKIKKRIDSDSPREPDGRWLYYKEEELKLE